MVMGRVAYIELMRILFYLLVATTLSVMGKPVKAGGWDGVRLYGHAYANKDYSQEGYEFIAEHFAYHTIEKRHAHQVYGPRSTQEASRKTADRIKVLNPEAQCLFYWNMDLIYGGLYECFEGFVEKHPTWVKKSRFTVAPAPYGFDLSSEEAKQFWLQTVTNEIQNSSLDGAFLDASSKADLNGQLEIIHALMSQIPGTVIYNGFRYHPKKGFFGGHETLKHADGVFVEAFLSGPVNTAERAAAVLDALMDLPTEKIVICNGLSDGFGSNGSHTFSLAAYLIVAQENTYYRYGKGHHFDDKYMTYWHEDFGKELGKPLGKAQKNGLTYTREYEKVSVSLNLQEQQAKITWK